MVGTAERDAVVIGAGPAGTVAAITLARAGHRVLLVPGDGRRGVIGETLPAAARPLLVSLDLPDLAIDETHATCIGNRSSWGSDDVYFADSVFDPNGAGLRLDRAAFDAALLRAAVEAHVEVVEGMRLAAVRQLDSDLELSLAATDRSHRHVQTVRARWTVDASGAGSTVARLLGIRRQRDSRLVAFCALLEHARPSDEDGCTFVEAVEAGWWYTVLLPSGARAVCYVTDADLVDRRALLTVNGFGQALAQTRYIRAITAEGRSAMWRQPHAVGCATSTLAAFAGVGWCAAGDAAMSFDPLSSQGVFNALYTGMRAGDAVSDALAGDDDASSRYTRRLQSILTSHRQSLAAFYRAERRWPRSTFWHRRSLNGA